MSGRGLAGAHVGGSHTNLWGVKAAGAGVDGGWAQQVDGDGNAQVCEELLHDGAAQGGHWFHSCHPGNGDPH